ncbi:diheme cytochrome c-553 [Flavitalea sp.]|nr:hypothetical protein [Flavitalea sp.]
MKQNILIVFTFITTIFIAVSCSNTQTDKQAITEIPKDSLVKRGEYLVEIMSCNDCHTPVKMTPQGPARDMDRILSGHPAEIPVFHFDTTSTKDWVLFSLSGTAMIGPWGASFAANLTSDETGIGSWTEEQFRKALTEGKFKGLDGTRPLLPPMPWENYKNIREEDIKAIFVYLKSIKPIKNTVPMPIAPRDLPAK